MWSTRSLNGVVIVFSFVCFFFSSRIRHTRFDCDWSSDVCSSDLDQMTESAILRSRPGMPQHAGRGPLSFLKRSDRVPRFLGCGQRDYFPWFALSVVGVERRHDHQVIVGRRDPLQQPGHGVSAPLVQTYLFSVITLLSQSFVGSLSFLSQPAIRLCPVLSSPIALVSKNLLSESPVFSADLVIVAPVGSGNPDGDDERYDSHQSQRDSPSSCQPVSQARPAGRDNPDSECHIHNRNGTT